MSLFGRDDENKLFVSAYCRPYVENAAEILAVFKRLKDVHNEEKNIGKFHLPTLNRRKNAEIVVSKRFFSKTQKL